MKIRDVGRRVAGIGLLCGSPAARERVALAARWESMLNEGRALGLTEDKTREVFRAWQSAYQATMDPLDWSKVRSAIVLRACGEEWRP